MDDTTASGPPIVEALDLQKAYGDVQAVRGISLAVRRGEVFGLLGPNGAGKTTLLRMMVHSLLPDAGSVRFNLDGEAIDRPPARWIGVLSEDRAGFSNIPILRVLMYAGVLRGISRDQAKAAGERWLTRVGLADRSRDTLEQLSTGNRTKVLLGAALIHEPRVAFLDEPFAGLDPVAQEMFVELIGELREKGTTIVMCDHQMQLVERVVDRVMLIDSGRSVRIGTVDELRRDFPAERRLTIEHDGKGDASALKRHESVAAVEADAGGRLDLLIKPQAPLSQLLVEAGKQLNILAIHSERLTLHDIYVRTMLGDGRP
jgi:ABC-2 type transport system ATP-binding protein